MIPPKKISKKHYTNEEIEVIKNYAGKESSFEIAKRLGRTFQSVQGKAWRMGISLDGYKETIICIDCGKERKVSPYVADRVERCEACQNLRTKQMMIEKQPERADIQYFNGNKHVALERDGFQCRLCGSMENLIIHHINEISYHNSTEPDNSLDNLTTLCLSCHSSYHSSRRARENRIKEEDFKYESQTMSHQ